MDRCYGRMGVGIRVSGNLVSNMEWVRLRNVGNPRKKDYSKIMFSYLKEIQ